jgi:hypothetical protein
MVLDFTLTKFRSLCSAVAQHYPTLTLAECFLGEKLHERALIIVRKEPEFGIRY